VYRAWFFSQQIVNGFNTSGMCQMISSKLCHIDTNEPVRCNDTNILNNCENFLQNISHNKWTNHRIGCL